VSNIKGVGGGVFELKIAFGPGYRVYFGKRGATVVILLGGGTKAAKTATSRRLTRAGTTSKRGRAHRRRGRRKNRRWPARRSRDGPAM
jgi:putative component of toxin-antitoxin plasmid stabilization module